MTCRGSVVLRGLGVNWVNKRNTRGGKYDRRTKVTQRKGRWIWIPLQEIDIRQRSEWPRASKTNWVGLCGGPTEALRSQKAARERALGMSWDDGSKQFSLFLKAAVKLYMEGCLGFYLKKKIQCSDLHFSKISLPVVCSGKGMKKERE